MLPHSRQLHVDPALRQRLATLSGWLAATLVVIPVLAAMGRATGTGPDPDWLVLATVALAALVIAFYVTAAQTGERYLRALATAGLTGAVLCCLGIFGVIRERHDELEWGVLVLVPGAALFVSCAELVLARLLRLAGARRMPWLAVALAGSWVLMVGYVWWHLLQAHRGTVVWTGLFDLVILFPVHCIAGALLLFMYRRRVGVYVGNSPARTATSRERRRLRAARRAS